MLGARYLKTCRTIFKCMKTREECLSLACIDSQPTHHHTASEPQLCWHCCHPYETTTIRLPVRYDDRRDQWTYIGQFCSWGCAKGHAIDAQRLDWCALLASLKRRTIGKYVPTTPAPPRRLLSSFGGTIPLKKFRSMSDDNIVVSTLPERMVPLEVITKQRKVLPRSKHPQQTVDHTVSFEAQSNEPVQKTMLRLKRPHASRTPIKPGGLDMFLKSKS